MDKSYQKLIKHKFLCLKFFCSSKIVDSRAFFAKCIAEQAFIFFILNYHLYKSCPLFRMLATGLHIGQHFVKNQLSINSKFVGEIQSKWKGVSREYFGFWEGEQC